MLTFCLKQIKGLNKLVKMVDAGFIWTEPHSRRIKVKLTVQKEVMGGTILQKTIVIEYVVKNLQCEDCKRTYTPHAWNSIVQVRQRVEHKRTFLFLEQLILKHNMSKKCSDIAEIDGGLDSQFSCETDAAALSEFIKRSLACKAKQSKQLVSHDERNSTYHYKYTFLIDLAPICREDLVILPKKLARDYGGIGPMILIYKISKSIHIVDINTMRTFEIDQAAYWKHPFKMLAGRDRLTEFIVVDIENLDTDVNDSRAAIKQKFRHVKVEVARKSDFGQNEQTYFVNCHLGEILEYNDTVLAYDLEHVTSVELEQYREENDRVPEIVIVKKTYPKYRKQKKNRNWKLKHLDKQAAPEEEEEPTKEDGKKKKVPKRA